MSSLLIDNNIATEMHHLIKIFHIPNTVIMYMQVFKLRKNFNRLHKRRCGKVEDLYGTGNASTYMNFGDNLYNPAPKIPDPDYCMG